MGADAARRLSDDGFQIAILSSSGRGEALASELGGVGVTGSNRSVDDLGALVDRALERWGRIDALVNSAGHGPKGPVLEISDDDWHVGMETYLLNVIRPTRLVTPHMCARGGGVIVNISTFAVFEPDPLFPTSGVFRAALAGFTKLFADKYASGNVRMNNILPGFIDSLPEAEDRRARVPMGRYGKAGRGVGAGGLSLFAGCGLCHRAEHSHRRRADPLGIDRLGPFHVSAGSPRVPRLAARVARADTAR